MEGGCGHAPSCCVGAIPDLVQCAFPDATPPAHRVRIGEDPMRRPASLLLLGLTVLLASNGCAPSRPAPDPIVAHTPTATPEPTSTFEQAATPQPTATPEPTATSPAPRATATPRAPGNTFVITSSANRAGARFARHYWMRRTGTSSRSTQRSFPRLLRPESD